MTQYSHVILVSLDTLRADCIARSPIAYEFKRKYPIKQVLATEPLDKLLLKGLYFNHCISAAPYTSASHATYFTGMWPRRHGVYEFFHRKLQAKTLFQYAKEQGYETFFQTDFPVILGKYLGFTRGVDHYYIEDEMAALRELRRRDPKRSFSFFHFGGIHYPYGFHTLKFGEDSYRKKVQEMEYHYAPLIQKVNDTLDESFRSSEDREYLLRYKRVIETLYNRKEFTELFSLYIEGINYFINTRFTQFLSSLSPLLEKKDTLLVLFSDHGEAWDEDTYGHFNSVGPEVTHVPLLFLSEHISPGIVDPLVRTLDVAPTIMKCINADTGIISTMDGSPLAIHKPENIQKAPFALAQTWLNSTSKQKVAEYQQHIIKETRQEEPLFSYLFREMVTNGTTTLLRSYNQKGDLLRETCESEAHKTEKDALRNILHEYNQISVSSGSRIEPLSALRVHLRDMGYNI